MEFTCSNCRRQFEFCCAKCLGFFFDECDECWEQRLTQRPERECFKDGKIPDECELCDSPFSHS